MRKLLEIDNKHRSDKQLSEILKQLEIFVREKHYLFDYYRRHKNIQKPFIINIFWNSILDFYWRQKISRALTCLILFLIFAIRIDRLFTKQIDNSNSWILVIVFLFSQISLLIQLTIFIMPYFQKMAKDISNPARYIYLAESYDPINHLNIIKNIGENNSFRDIKTEEQRFRLIMISHARAKNLTDSAIPLISFICALFGLFMLGTPQNWGNSLEIATIAGFGFIPLITVTFSFIIELLSENLLIYQHCLFILQEALIIADKREISQNHSSLNKDIKGRRLIEGIKNINYQ